MTVKPFVYEFVFRANTTAAKATVEEMRRKVANVTAASEGSTAAIGKHSTKLDKDAVASRRAAKALDELTLAEKRARDQLLRGTGTGGMPHPVRQPTVLPPRPAPVPSPVPAPDPKQLDDLRAQYVPLYAAQRAYQSNVDDLNKAEKLGALSTEEYAGAQSHLRLAYDRNVEGIKRINPVLRGAKDTMKLSSHEAKILNYQLNDIFQTLALGMPISQVAMQQGPQITQIYGGVGNTFKALKAVLTPVRLALGATAAVAVTGAVAYNSYLKSTKAVEVASLGLGRAVAGSAADMEASARAGAVAAGISISSARAMEVQFLRTGSIGSENFDELIGMSKDFATTIGINADQAGGVLAEMFADPAKAADALYRKYGLIDAATARHATNLARQNRVSEAQAVLLVALPDRLVAATKATTLLGRAWADVKTHVSNAGNAMGSAIDTALGEGSLEDRIQFQRDRANAPNTGANFWIDRDAAKNKLDELLAEQAEAAAKSLRDQAAKKGAVALGLAKKSPVNDNALREEQLRNRLAALQAGASAPDQDAEQQRQVAAAIGGTAHALAGLINRRQRALDLDKLDVQIQHERNPLLRAEMEARRARLNLADKEISATELAIAAGRARNRVMLETTSAAAAQAADLRSDTVARRIINDAVAKGTITSEDANRALQEELVLRPLIAAAALAEGAEKARLVEVIRELQRGYAGLAVEQKRASGLDLLRGQSETLEKLKIETGLLGQNAIARARILALHRADLEIRQRGIDPNGAQARDIRSNAAQIANKTYELEKRAQAAGLRADAAARRRINDAVAKGTITSEDANRALQEELTLRPLITAAALAEGDEKARLLDVIRDLKNGYAGLAVEQKRASGLEFLRGQSETLEGLQIESTLLGQNAATRARILALHRAELEIRHRGIDPDGAQAREMRSNAVQIASSTREIEKQATAWGKVQSAAEGAIDSMTDNLLRGDLSGFVDDLAREITGMLTEIGIKNPLKNAILGTDYGTADDLGGLKGIWARLTGKGGDAKLSSLGSQVYTVSSMSVTAASIIINGGAGAGALLGNGGSGALAGGSGILGGGSGTLAGSGSVQQQIWNFFKAKGLTPQQIAGIMGNVSAESGFNPIAKGDGGHAFGLFQHNDRAPALFNHIGGEGGLGNVQAQLEFAWKELLTTERASLERLLASTDVRGATGAFVGFERPQGYKLNNPEGSMHWSRRLAAAEAALTKFGGATTDATLNLGDLGTGFDAFGQFLSKIGTGSGAGVEIGGGTGGGGFWSTILQIGGQLLGLPGFAVGGATGGSDPAKVAGLVHEREYVFDAAATARIGVSTLEAMRKGSLRGFRSGGYAVSAPTVSAANWPVAPVTPAPIITIVNNSSLPISEETESTVDASGQRTTNMVIADTVGQAMTTPGGGAKKVLRRHGLRQRGALR